MKNFNLDAILEAMLRISDRVSDLNFSVGRPPQVEIDGVLVPVNFPGLPRLTPFQTEILALHMLRGDRELTRALLANGSVDLSYSIPQKTRFRVNVFSQRGTYAIVPARDPRGRARRLESLKLPQELYNVCQAEERHRCWSPAPRLGQVDHARGAHQRDQPQTTPYHIITIEDPSSTCTAT
jgi:twitching motility protein PilT